jgi:hypothetical protein
MTTLRYTNDYGNGHSGDEITAALMYDAKAFELRGDKARLNFPHEMSR